MMNAALAANAPFASANVEFLVSADRGHRSCVELYERGEISVTVTRWAGKMTIKLAKHGTVAEFSTRQGDTLRSVGAVVEALLNCDSITTARLYMKKVCRDSKRLPN